MGIALVLCFIGGASGYPSEQWNRTFGGFYDEVANSVKQTSDGGYILAGRCFIWTYDVGGKNFDALLIKTDANGNQQWDQKLGGVADDWVNSVQETTDGGYILTGVTSSYGNGDADAWLIKTDANGTQQWYKTFSGPKNDIAKSVQQTSDGGYILAGGYAMGGGSYNAWLIKTDANGSKLWSKTFGDEEVINSIDQTLDGGYILAGYVGMYDNPDSDHPDSDAALIKTDAKGNQIWSKKFVGEKKTDSMNSIQQTSDGGYILAGTTRSYGAGGSDAWLIKTDANGSKEWNREKTFGGSGNDIANSVVQTSDGGYLFAGGTEPYGATKLDALVVKTDVNGNELWRRTFGKTESDWINSVHLTSDGGIILAGVTYSYGNGSSDAWLIKISGDSDLSPTPNPMKTETLIPLSSPTLTLTPTSAPTSKTTELINNSSKIIESTPIPITSAPSTPRMPGFEIILAIAGISTMLYLRRYNR